MPLKWDSFSDQPEVITDRAFKQRIYKATRWDSAKLLATNLLFYPIAFLFYGVIPVKKQLINTREFFAMSINLDKNPKETRELVDELQVNHLLIRLPLHDIENLHQYLDFAEQFKDKEILFNILQDRRHVEDSALLKQSLKKIFKQFGHLSQRFQIGNAINRKKWAFFSMDEYLAFYKVAYDLKQSQFPTLKLLGSAVIDFEYYFSIRTLFNGYKIHFDQFSSLLYVDRRGAPENTQMGLDLEKKLYLLQAMLRISPKSNTEIVITETNWPIKNTKPYAPTSEKECVNLEEHANYLVRYYLLALATGVVTNVYWHQLIAPGYGLIDNREGKLVKYPAFAAFKTMLSLLQGADFKKYKKQGGCLQLFFMDDQQREIEVCWSLMPKTIKRDNKTAISRDGEKIQAEEITMGEEPIYLISEKA